MIRIIVALTCLLIAAVSFANENGEQGHHFESNEIGVFFGGTVPFDEIAGGYPGYTIGLEYERRLSPTIGAVLIAEYVSEKHKRDNLLAVMFAYRLKNFRLAGGPGMEIAEKDESGGGTKLSSYFLLATRANYNIHLRKVTLAPTVGVDLIGETKTNFVFGVALGYGF